MRRFTGLLGLILILFAVVGADAASINLPAGLTRIEEEAFYGDTSLDEVVIGNKTQTIGSRAFAKSSVRKVTIPESVRFIADDAFDGVEGLVVSAMENTYAYSWAIKHGYIKAPDVQTDSETVVVLPEKLQAGMNLEVQVFGPENTVSHTVILINNETKARETRWIRSQNGTVKWEGYELVNGSYTVKVYTVSDAYSVASPVSKAFTVSGTRPVGPDDIVLPDKIGWEGCEIRIEPYDHIMINQKIYDADGNIIDEWMEEPASGDSFWLWTGSEDASTMTVSLASYKDGLWSEWTEEKEIEIDRNYHTKYPGLKSLTIPENITAGKDFEISFELEKSVNFCWVCLWDQKDNTLQYLSDSNVTNMDIIVPGYKLDPGAYRLVIEAETETEDEGYVQYNILDQTVTVADGRKPANITLEVNKSSVYTNEDVIFSIESNGLEGAYIKVEEGDDISYIGCNLQTDGSGSCTTTLEVLRDARSAVDAKLSACVYLEGCWSEWSEPIAVHVMRPEPLPVPVIHANDSYEAGEDIIVSLSNVEDADRYYVYFREYFSNDRVDEKYFYKDDSWNDFGKDVIFEGSQFGSGTYVIEVEAYSNIRESNSARKTVKVTGTRPAAPVVTYQPEEFTIKQTTTFTIDTTDCEQVYIKYEGRGNSNYWSDIYSFAPTGDTTTWEYTFNEDSESAAFTFEFSVKRDGKWTNTREIRKTVRGLPQLDAAVIHVDDYIEAGTDFTVSVDPVENATSYEYRLYRTNGDDYISGTSEDVQQRYYGYEVEPGEYRIVVYAHSTDYATSSSEKTIIITGSKAAAPYVAVDKSEVFTNDTFTFTIDTRGTTLVFKRDRWGNRRVINVTSNETKYSDSWGGTGDYYYQFAALKDGKWTSLSDPIHVKVNRKPVLEAPVVMTNGVLNAGRDFSLQFKSVENATSYRVSFGYPYENMTLYSFSTADALPESTLTVPGYLIGNGNYVVTVTAYADGYESNSKRVYLSTTGSKLAAPVVTVDTPLRIKGDAVFVVDTKNAEDMVVRYQYTSDRNWWSEQEVNVPVTDSATEWRLKIDEYMEGANLTISIAIKVDGVWTEWNTNNYVIEGLPQLEAAVIHVDDTVGAGNAFTVSIDPVENATSYYYELNKPNGNTYWSGYSIDERTYQGYELEPGEYTIEAYAYSNDHATSKSIKTFTIVGEKALAPHVSADKTDFYSNETRPVFTIVADGAEAVRCSDGSVALVNEDGVATISPYMYVYETQRTYDFEFCYVKEDAWSAWSEPISITIRKAPSPEPLGKAVIHLPETINAGCDFEFSFDAVENATSYEAYISHYYVNANYYSNYSAKAGEKLTVSGRTLAAGTYVARVYAYAEGRTSSSSSVIFKVTGDRASSPTVTMEKGDYSAGDQIDFSIDTEGAEELYINYSYTGDYSSSGSRTITVEQDKTEWTYSIPSYHNGVTYTFSFYLKREGKWSKPKTVTIVIPTAN